MQGMSEAQAFLESFCPQPKPAIVMDEIVSNIVRCSGSDEFSVSLTVSDSGFTMTFSDAGTPFDPTQDAASPDISAAAADRPIGGLGLFMVRKMSKSVTYQRLNDKNVLTVVI